MAGQAHHRFPGNFFNIMYTPLQIKKSLFPEGNKDRKDNFCGTTLFAGKSGHLNNGANTPSAR